MGQIISNKHYDLSILNNNNNNNNNNNITNKYYVFDKETFNVIKYVKIMLNDNNCNELGHYRSVILKNGELKVFSPPKSVKLDKFIESNNFDDLIINEFIEGTMINVFWNNDKWEIATKSSVGGNVSFFTLDKTFFARKENTFRYMFDEAIKYYDKNLTINNLLDSNNEDIKKCSFSFVLQHPANRIVVPFDKPSIYLVAIYKIDNFNVTRINITDDIKKQIPSFIRYPKLYNNYNNFDEVKNNFGVCDYKTVGIMITNKYTFERTKIRNKAYENVKLLRGNQPKLQYRYLMLRQSKQLTEYLTYYPEQKEYFDKFRDQIHSFTKDLYDEYVKCFIRKQVHVKHCRYHLRPHIVELHNIYKSFIKNNHHVMQRKITYNIVKDYVNNLHPAKLMYSMNYVFYNSENTC